MIGCDYLSLVLCPECGTKISDQATACPYCGYRSINPSIPISVQETYEIVPVFSYEIEEWKPNCGDLSIISYESNKSLMNNFGKWETIQAKLPAIADVIKDMASKDHVLVAKIDEYVQKLIDQGVYKFTIAKNGEILPTIRDAKGIVKQVRLGEMAVHPNIAQSLNNLSTQAVLARILDEIEYVGDAIREIHVELQNDRLAMAEAAHDKLLQTRTIQDAKLRGVALLNVINSATDAKRTLMRNFAQNMNYISEHSQKSDIKMMMNWKGERDVSQKAIDSFLALVHITNSVQTECEGYAMLDEYDACKECLNEFRTFIIENKLNKRDTLLVLNENSSRKRIEVVNEFSDIARRITVFSKAKNLTGNQMHKILAGSIKDGGKNNE